ncbi:MAG: type II toxin-antitoxin system RelE/ParE family toxin [Henriciella sp.]
MAQIIWTEPALADLNGIAEYIDIENPAAARDLVRRVFATVDRLERHPASGKYPDELEGKRYREVVCGPCRVFYRHPRGRVIILFVMRSERRLRHFLLEDRDIDSD